MKTSRFHVLLLCVSVLTLSLGLAPSPPEVGDAGIFDAAHFLQFDDDAPIFSLSFYANDGFDSGFGLDANTGQVIGVGGHAVSDSSRVLVAPLASLDDDDATLIWARIWARSAVFDAGLHWTSTAETLRESRSTMTTDTSCDFVASVSTEESQRATS